MPLHLSLKQSWTLIALFVVIIPITIFGGISGSIMFKQQLREALVSVRHANTTLQFKIDSEIESHKALLKNQSEALSHLLKDIDSPDALSQIYSLLARIDAQKPAIHEVLILSPHAQIIAVVDQTMEMNGDHPLSPKELHAAAVRAGFNTEHEIPEIVIPQAGKVYIGSPHEHDNIIAFTIAVPIGSPTKATLIAFIEVEELLRSRETHHKLATSTDKTQNYILGRRGELLTILNEEKYKTGDLMTHFAIVRSALINEEWPADESYTGVHDQPVYGSHTAIQTLNWSLISEVSSIEIIQPIASLLFKLAVVTLFGIAITIWFVLRLVDRTINPIQQASKAIENIASGNFELELSPSGVHEFDVMIRSITSMAENRQSVEQALQKKEQEQREILSSMIDAVITINELGIVLTFNRAAELLFGYSADEMIGNNVNMLMPEPFAKKHDHYLQRYCDTNEVRIVGKTPGVEVPGRHKNKTIFPLRLSINELPRDLNNRRCFIGSCHDLTTVKHQEEQLRRAQKMTALGTLTGGIAHDFNNILGVVIGYSGLLSKKLSSEPKLAGHANKIIHAAERGASLTKKLLGLSRQHELVPSRVDLNTLIHDQLDFLKKTLTPSIELKIDLENPIWPIWLDKHGLDDALLNISINASHAMAKASPAQLSISSRNKQLNKSQAQGLGLAPGDYVQLKLTDTGIGMDEKTKEQIFDPFFSTKGNQGSGLGLSQVFGFVAQAGGVIKVDSTLGAGTQFTLYFPRLEDDAILTAQQPELETETTPTFHGNESILIVDDEEALCELSEVLFKEQGYQVFTATNSDQALLILQQQTIDLIYCDVVMLGIDGYQFAELVQQNYPQIKIQMTSGFTDDRQLNIDDQKLHQNILYKPVDTEKLLKRIRDLLSENPNREK